ncbi:hypothetical protein BGX31_001212, partial [Mortierella sp. GBA43]
MDTTQTFRLAGSTQVLEIPCDQDDDQNVIYWDDILDVFPGVLYVKNGSMVVKRLRDSDPNSCKPRRIKHHPGVTLDVVLSNSTGNGSTIDNRSDSPSNVSTADDTVNSQRIATTITPAPNNDPYVETSPNCSLPPGPHLNAETYSPSPSSCPIVEVGQTRSLESDIDQRLLTLMPPETRAQLEALWDMYNSFLRAVQDGQIEHSGHLNLDFQECSQKLMTELAAPQTRTPQSMELMTHLDKLREALNTKQDEMDQIQRQMLDQLTLLQNRVQTVLTQNHQLQEHSNPRLFVVLPQDSASWDPLDLHSNKFRLYFLCECGYHTTSKNTKTQHHIHFARHEGYHVIRTKEFFQHYGSYVLNILKMLKFRILVDGITIPSLSELVSTDTMDQPIATLKALEHTIKAGVDQVIHYIERVSSGNGNGMSEFPEQMQYHMAEESFNLRKLRGFLRDMDGDRPLGNLYRVLTSEGYIKWVCVEHCQENYQEKSAKELRKAMQVIGGSFDENFGRVKATIRSEAQADQFYQALENTSSVYELRIALDWSTTQQDFKRLRDTLIKTNIAVLELNLVGRYKSTNNILLRNRIYDPIFDIMRLSSIKSISLIQPPRDFIQRSSLAIRSDDFPNLRYLEIDIRKLHADMTGFQNLVKRAPNITTLMLDSPLKALVHAYNAVVERHTFSISFRNPSLCIPPPPTSQSTGTVQDMAQLFRLYGAQMEAFYWDEDVLDDGAVQAFAEAIQTGSALKELTLTKFGRQLSDQCIGHLAIIIAGSGLHKLQIDLEDQEEERPRVLERIQWAPLQQLTITLRCESSGTSLTTALLCSSKSLGKMDLEHLTLDCKGSLSSAAGEQLQSFVSKTSLRRLELYWKMSLDQVLGLLRSLDVSQMQSISLSSEHFSQTEVQMILDKLQGATKLLTLCLRGANITERQKALVSAKGTTLQSPYSLVLPLTMATLPSTSHEPGSSSCTQSFRLDASTDTKKIPFHFVDGKYVVRWSDIETAFPGVKYVKDGDHTLTLMTDSNQRSSRPSTLSSSRLQLPAKEKDQEAEVEMQLFSSLPPEVQAMIHATSDSHGSVTQSVNGGQTDYMCLLNDKFMRRFLALMAHGMILDKVHSNKDDMMRQLRIQPLYRLYEFRGHVQAILSQKHEDPSPRLFIALPEDVSRWEDVDTFENKCRLYFLCECGESTGSVSGKTVHIHLAKHEGYDIDRPKEFFQLYGRYILTILRMIKYRISMTGVHVPPVSDLVPAGTVDQLGTSLEALKDTIELGIDQVIGCLESVDTNDGEDGDGITGTTGYNEALRRVDLGNLSMFLKRKDDGTALGNLIRTAATDKGIVKW